MNKIIGALIYPAVAVTLLSSCGGDDSNKDHGSSEVKGGVYMGGVARLNEVESIKSLFPIAINDVVSYHLGAQVYEGLVKYSQTDLSLLPGIAYKWEISADQLEYTFHLRKGVKFHDDACFADGKGRELTANDFKFCLDKLCSADPSNNQFDYTFKDIVVGANEAYADSKSGKKTGVTGVKVINDSTLSIRLTHIAPSFMNLLAMPGCYVYPQEALTKYGADMRIKAVGTGPFVLDQVKEGEVIIMKKNPHYWGVDENGNKLPYLDGLKWSFIREKKSEVLEFKRGNLDMIYRIPVEMFHELMGDLEHAKDRKSDFIIINSTALNTNYFGFNCQSNLFSKKDVRLAFNYAIDRQKIADFTIQGEGSAADYGFVPYNTAFEKAGYNYKALKGYSYDPDKAKELLKQAGYPGGKGFPKITLEINPSGGDRNILVATVVQKMLKENLNVDMDINIVPLGEHIENVQSAKTDFFRFAWVADYPDPETFLTMFYGQHVPKSLSEKAYMNFGRYVNPHFDSAFSAAKLIQDKAQRFAALAAAEQIMLDDAPTMPIFYDENFRLEQLNVRNLPENPMNYMDFCNTYLIPPDKMPKK
ncbi:MAG: ABC transporter substrate-binding protein [Bacteroidia bacterium]